MGPPDLNSQGAFLYLSEQADGQQAIMASSMTGGNCEGAEDAHGCAGLLPAPENTAREGLLPTTHPSAMAQSLSPQILIRLGQKPRECLHPGSYS